MDADPVSMVDSALVAAEWLQPTKALSFNQLPFKNNSNVKYKYSRLAKHD